MTDDIKMNGKAYENSLDPDNSAQVPPTQVPPAQVQPDNVAVKPHKRSVEFSETVKRDALAEQTHCPLTGIRNQHVGTAQLYDYDHIIKRADGGQGTKENCQVLNVIAHRIKTNDPERFDTILKDIEETKDFRYKIVKDIISQTGFTKEQVNDLIVELMRQLQ